VLVWIGVVDVKVDELETGIDLSPVAPATAKGAGNGAFRFPGQLLCGGFCK
jgi:hypothetical protein